MYWQFSDQWWLVLGLVYVPYIFLLVSRKSYQKPREIKHQLIMGGASTLLSLIVEIIGKGVLWTYLPGNWPVILWPVYFGVALLGYQLVKKIEEVIKG